MDMSSPFIIVDNMITVLNDKFSYLQRFSFLYSVM